MRSIRAYRVVATIGIAIVLSGRLPARERWPARRGGQQVAQSQPAKSPPTKSLPVDTLPGNELFAPGETSATFQLFAANAPDRPSPELELLFSSDNQQAIAALLKDERNKGLKPGLIAPQDRDANGIKVRFDAIRFLRDEDDPDLAQVRLVGPVNEVKCQQPLSISKLLHAQKPVPVQFQSVTHTSGVTVTITTDMRLLWDDGNLAINGTTGTIDFAVGRFSPARLFYSSDIDRVKLPDLRGKRISDDALVRRSLLEPEKL